MNSRQKQQSARNYVLEFTEIARDSHSIVGGKAANLGALGKIAGLNVPEGFCISAKAYQIAVDSNPPAARLIARLQRLKKRERDQIPDLARETRDAIGATPLPSEISAEILQRLSLCGSDRAYAIRSSATAEDLPGASFAGQHDSFLNISGEASVLAHVRKCWASLFTDRAIRYRVQHGFDHERLSMAVVVQEMVPSEASGVVFTADPLNGNRELISVEAGRGLGEDLVSGRINVDQFQIQAEKIISRKIHKDDPQQKPVLTDTHVLELARIGKKIEGHFGQPQDIEWCLHASAFHIVQSRPITTLFPIPESDPTVDAGTSHVASRPSNRVFISVGHQQMMTDAIKPLGLSFWKMTALRPFHQAAGRLFVDVTPMLASPDSRKQIMNLLGKSDPLIQDAVNTILGRRGYINPSNADNDPASKSLPDFNSQAPDDPSLVTELITSGNQAVEALRQSIRTRSGPVLFDFIEEDMHRLRNLLADPESFPAIMTGINASAWINEHMEKWLGEKGAADTLSQSVPHNVTSEMGLDLLDVADTIRPYPEIVAWLENVMESDQGDGDHFPDRVLSFEGGQEVHGAIRSFLSKYGMRCAGEIDITRTRWSEKPAILIPLLLSNIRNFKLGAGKRKFETGRLEALQKEQDLLDRLKKLPDGNQKAGETARMIRLLRNFIGYREYPKYMMVSHYFHYKQALMKEAERLVHNGLLRHKHDAYFLSFEEFRNAVGTHTLDYQLITQRKADYMRFEQLTPPRVITSDGEIIRGEYNRKGMPSNALPGLPVSAGVSEGRARVLRTLDESALEAGDILVTSFTDPSWTPAFLSIEGLVTEVGGLMTHGAVIAREYGLPAVVGVHQATHLIRDGQRIRVHGTAGYVEILKDTNSQ